MRNSLKRDNQLSLLSHLNCDSELVSPLIDVEEKMAVKVPCIGNGVNVIDCRHIDRHKYIEEAHGLDFHNKTLSGPTVSIAQDIPVIPPECFDREPETIDSNIVGVRLYDILSIKPRRKMGFYQLQDGVHIDLGVLSKSVFRGKKIVLICTGMDVVIEKLWWLRNDINLFDTIARAKFDAVVGMNFSLFLGECPLAQLLNLNKSLVFCQELSKRGVAVLPHVYAINDQQRSKWVNYLNENPLIETIVINTQLQKDPYSMHQVRLTTEALLINTEVTIILNGYGLKNLPPESAKRVFVANQRGMKKDAIIESAVLKRYGTAAA